MPPAVSPARRVSPSERRIVEAARHLFMERGLAGVNMDLIASEAGVARQTLYNRFGSKDAVFQAALGAHWASLERAAAEHLDNERSPADVLTDVAADVIAFVRDRDQVAMTRMVIGESRHDPDLARTFFERGKGPLMASFVNYLASATGRGMLNCTDPELAAREYLGMIQESLLWPYVMGTDGPKRSEKTVVASAIRVFLAAYSAL